MGFWTSTLSLNCFGIYVVYVLSILATNQKVVAITISKKNPRYFDWGGKEAIALVTSAEHYGGLINKDFNENLYFKTLAANNFTLTQAFIGTYVEPDSDCNPTGSNPQGNTLSPANGSFLPPWNRVSGHPGGPFNGNKFDLTSYNPEYFARLDAYVMAASNAGVVVQLVMFCGYDAQEEFIFAENPLNPVNNINGFNPARVNRTSIYSLAAGEDVLGVELETIKRVVAAVQSYDNVIFELVFTTKNVSAAWGAKVATTIRNTNPNSLIVVTDEWIPLMPFHDGILLNCGSGSKCNFKSPTSPNQPNLLDSAGLANGTVASYRKVYWAWLFNGGGSIYNLDWSYTVDHEDGTKKDAQTQTTPSGPDFRKALSILACFMVTLDLAVLQPDRTWIQVHNSNVDDGDAVVSAMAPMAAPELSTPTSSSKNQFAAYVNVVEPTSSSPSFSFGNAISVDLSHHVEANTSCDIVWIDPVISSNSVKSELFKSQTSWFTLNPPPGSTNQELAFRITC